MHVRKLFVVAAVLSLGAVGLVWFTVWKPVAWLLILLVPVIALGIGDMIQKRHAILRNYPVVGHFRYLLEHFRPEIMQYFVETDTEGRPINRIFRTLVYERAKGVNDTTPFGTQMDVYAVGYEWMDHSVYPRTIDPSQSDLRVQVGGSECTRPYSASVLNISAMSFGSLSKNAVMAMNWGAKIGGFAQNTGEGGLSPHHLKYGGDVIWQVGTGYFGCRNPDGSFSPELFKERASKDVVKMIEIKISQGAKPGHGGILPAVKNTEEIAAIRLVEPGTDVISPPGHTAFSDADGLMRFVRQLRELSGGKPVGFKLCIGRDEEFEDICEAMVRTGIKPDFVTIDGGEGGTGAAPVEFSNSLGMPLREGLAFAADTLLRHDLKKDVVLIASGKILSGFHMARAIALGADMCNIARGMMLAAGCIQARECNRNTCPVGVATQDPRLIKGLVVEDKAQRIANYHEATLRSFLELLGAAGMAHPRDLNRSHIYRRVSPDTVKQYDEIFPYPDLEAHA